MPSHCPYARVTDETLKLLGLDESHRGIVRYGVHMGIPSCCINHYVRVWIDWGPEGVPVLYEESNHDPDEATRKRLWAEHPTFMTRLDECFRFLKDTCRDVEYVLCPGCVRDGRRVATKSIDVAACGCWGPASSRGAVEAGCS